MSTIVAQTNHGERVPVSQDEIDALRQATTGDILLRFDPEYEEACKLWNGMIQRHPAMIVRCHVSCDVQMAVQFAAQRDLVVSVRSGGHNVAGNALRENALTIDLSRMRDVRVDPESQTVWAQGGCQLGDVDAATQVYGLAVPLGVVSETGVAGLSLHGGLGWLSRKYGTASDNIRAVDIVTADGRMRHADAETNPDLYWAVRGGGGNFGVVTAFEFKAYPVGPTVYQIQKWYPLEKALPALRVFRDMTLNTPEDLGMIAALWSAPDEADVPEEIRGKPVFVFLGVWSGDLDEVPRVLQPLETLGDPAMDESAARSFVEVQKMLDPEYPDGRQYYWKSLYLPDLEDAAIEDLVRATLSRPSPLTSIDIWAVSGAFSRVPENQTAFAHRDAPFLFNIEANWDDPQDTDINIAWARELFARVRERYHTSTYLNFPGLAEEREQMVQKAFGANYDRLRQVKRNYDPKNLFRGHLNIVP